MHKETTEEWEATERVSGDPLREWYTKEIWGKRAVSDDSLFEVMSLQVFQAGLTWRMVLSRRDSFRAAFAGWKIGDVDERESRQILQRPNGPRYVHVHHLADELVLRVITPRERFRGVRLKERETMGTDRRNIAGRIDDAHFRVGKSFRPYLPLARRC